MESQSDRDELLALLDGRLNSVAWWHKLIDELRGIAKQRDDKHAAFVAAGRAVVAGNRDALEFAKFGMSCTESNLEAHFNRSKMQCADLNRALSLAKTVIPHMQHELPLPNLGTLVKTSPADAARACNKVLSAVLSTEPKGPGKRRPKNRRGGKPKYTHQERKRVVDAWGTGRHRTAKELAGELGGEWTASKVKRILDAERKRTSDAQKRAAE